MFGVNSKYKLASYIVVILYRFVMYYIFYVCSYLCTCDHMIKYTDVAIDYLTIQDEVTKLQLVNEQMNNVINNQKTELSTVGKVLELKEAEASQLALQKIQEVMLLQTIVCVALSYQVM